MKLKDTPDPFALLREYDREVEAMERGKGEEEMQMTQLGYEDAEGRMCREKMVRKMGGDLGDLDEGGREEKSSRQVVRDEGGVRSGKGEGVAGRTRGAGRV